jgi:hypothetical protein
VSVSTPLGTDHQLARLLQIGMVLEEVVEARAAKHARAMEADLDEPVRALLSEAATESAAHRERLATLVDELDADPIPFDQIEGLVEAQYGQTKPEDFDGVLYDQLCNEETAYKFYDDLIAAVEASDARFSVERERLLDVLVGLREEEAQGVERVTRLMDREAVDRDSASEATRPADERDARRDARRDGDAAGAEAGRPTRDRRGTDGEDPGET